MGQTPYDRIMELEQEVTALEQRIAGFLLNDRQIMQKVSELVTLFMELKKENVALKKENVALKEGLKELEINGTRLKQIGETLLQTLDTDNEQNQAILNRRCSEMVANQNAKNN